MSDIAQPKTPRAVARLVATGFIMGAADVVPGVSGGTMAFVLGIYDGLLEAIAAFDLTSLRLALSRRGRALAARIKLAFISPVGVGILLAIVTLAPALERTLDDPRGRTVLFAAFFGLVAASTIVVGRRFAWSAPTTALAVGAGLGALLIARAIPVTTPATYRFAILSGALAICAMVLPGISGSFILLLLGQYERALTAVTEPDFALLGAFGLGAVVGVVLFVRLLRWVLSRFRPQTLATLTGFMAGSMWKLWPWTECTAGCLGDVARFPSSGDPIGWPLFAAAAGFGVVLLLDMLQHRVAV